MGYKYKINKNYFKNIDSEYKAYILGFIYADGSVYRLTENRQLNLRISMQEEDGYILDKLSKDAAGGQKYWSNPPSKAKKGWKPLSIVNICSEELCNDLINLGCKMKKSQNGMIFPELNEQYYKHFIRGFLDGDGSIILKKLKYYYKRKTFWKVSNAHKQQYKLRIAFTSTDKTFLLNIAKHLKLDRIYIVEKLRKIYVYTLWIENKKEVEKVINYLYNDSTYFLKRKYDKVIEFNKTISSQAIDTSMEGSETT